MSEEDVEAVRTRHRSPSFPSIDLQTAVRRAAELWEIAGRHPVAVPTALEAWGYSPKSSGGFQTVAALKKFGLVADEGSKSARQLQLTAAGRQLAYDHKEGDRSADWASAVRNAALSPTIHAEIWDFYDGELPPDDRVIRRQLVHQWGFSDAAAADVLSEFRKTVTFAELDSGEDPGGSAPGPAEPPREVDDESRPTPLPPALSVQRASGAAAEVRADVNQVVRIPVSPGEWVSVGGAFPISEAEWDALVAILGAMKAGLTRPGDS